MYLNTGAGRKLLVLSCYPLTSFSVYKEVLVHAKEQIKYHRLVIAFSEA